MWKHTSEGVNNPVQRKFIVDINSQLPVLLCIADASDPNLLTSTYFYADAQVVHQRQMVDPGIPDVYEAGYYVHDRLGSVRLVVRAIEEAGGVVVRAFNSTTYTPYGQFYEAQQVENINNPFKFTGQWHDVEIDQYHLRARQYDPTMMRFTSRDPVKGRYQEPLTFHKYLYCLNEPIGRTDLMGLFSLPEEQQVVGTGESIEGAGAGGLNYSSLLNKCQNACDLFSFRNKYLELTTNSLKNFEQLGNSINQIHHLVGRGWGNITKYGSNIINSPSNLIKLPKQLHGIITQFFNSGGYSYMNGAGGSLQGYISGLSFSQQLEWGSAVLNYLLANGTMVGFDPANFGLFIP